MANQNLHEQPFDEGPRYSFGGCLVLLAALGVGYLAGMGLEEAINPTMTEMALRAPNSGLINMVGTVVENLPIPLAIGTGIVVELVRNIFRK